MAAASATQNANGQAASKSSKKKGKAADRAASPAPTASPAGEKVLEPGQEDHENAYIRELQKNIRNINKKLANTSKTDAAIAEHAGKNLDELVAAKIINADQKAQILKKPGLQSQLTQLEEQLTQYKKVDNEYRARAAAEKADLEKNLTEKLNKEKAEAVRAAKEKAETEFTTGLHAKLLVVSQFLRLAAARRAEDADQTLEENLALEGVLLAVYSGDESAVSTMVKLVDGVEEPTMNTAGEQLQTTYAQVKAASQAYKPPYYAAEDADTKAAPSSDPTMLHATVTETAADDAGLVNGHTQEPGSNTGGPPNTDVTSDAANPAAESQWDAGNDMGMSMSMSQEWVSVPRDPAETETGLEATPAGSQNPQSWADEQPEAVPEPAQAGESNDGFHQVQRHRGRGDRDGNWRGRGRGEWRGRGHYRGDGRGRRGGPRGGGGGGGMGMRGQRRTEEA